MTHRPGPWLVLLLAVAAAVAAGSLRRLAGANADADAARADLARLGDDARLVLSLRRERATTAPGEPLQDDLIARLHAALARVGLPPATLRNVERVGDRAVDGAAALARRDVRVTLEPIDPPTVGMLLDHWLRTEPLWTPATIGLEARRGRAQPGDPRYTLRLHLTALYAQPAAPETGTP